VLVVPGPAWQNRQSVNVVTPQTLADASSRNVIVALVVVLVALGVSMLLVTIWLVRSTRPDRALLTRLEVMGTREWKESSTLVRQQRLDAVPVADAKDPTPGGGVARPELADEEEDVGSEEHDDGDDDIVAEPERSAVADDAEVVQPAPVAVADRVEVGDDEQ
jgi:hypothetical protein